MVKILHCINIDNYKNYKKWIQSYNSITKQKHNFVISGYVNNTYTDNFNRIISENIYIEDTFIYNYNIGKSGIINNYIQHATDDNIIIIDSDIIIENCNLVQLNNLFINNSFYALYPSQKGDNRHRDKNLTVHFKYNMFTIMTTQNIVKYISGGMFITHINYLKNNNLYGPQEDIMFLKTLVKNNKTAGVIKELQIYHPY